MHWPTPQEYNEAVQTPEISFSDKELMSGTVALTPIGLPLAMTGAFASVYRVSSRDGDWAVRCFLSNRPDQKERYQKISEFVMLDDLEETVEFHYLNEGIRVHGTWYPILKMRWVVGVTMDTFLIDHYRDREKLHWLRDQFQRLVRNLDDAGIAHGDLQHGNILVTDSGLRLVDYDALYVPALSGKTSLELGHPNYQHPQRSANHYDTAVDNFSCWLIDLSLAALAIDPDLFDDYAGGDECILFRRTDLRSPETSQLFNSLLNHASPQIKEKTGTLVRMLWARPELIPELHKIDELELLPRVKPVSTVEKKKDNYYHEHGEREEELTIDDVISGTRFHEYSGAKHSGGARPAGSRSGSSLRRASSWLGAKWSGFAERAQKFFLQDKWIEGLLARGDRHMGSSRYQKAIDLYMKAYRETEIPSYAFQSRFTQLRIEACKKLGLALIEQGNENLACNYFFVGYQICMNEGWGEMAKLRMAFYLAISRYLKDDVNEAYRVFSDNQGLLANIDQLATTESDSWLIQRPDVLALILGLIDRFNLSASRTKTSRIDLILDDPSTSNYHNVCSAALGLHPHVKERTSVELDKHCAALHLERSQMYFRGEDQNSARSHIRSLVDICDLILAKRGIQKPPPDDSESIKKLLRLAGVGDRKDSSGVVDFFQSLLNMTTTSSVEAFELELKKLDWTDTDSLCRIVRACLKERKDNLLTVPDLLERAHRKQYHALVDVFETILLENADENVDQVVDYLEFLSKSDSGERSDVILNSLYRSDKGLRMKIITRLSDEAYRKNHDVFGKAIVDGGGLEEILSHVRFLDRNFGTSKARGYTALVFASKGERLIVDLFNAMSSSDLKPVLESLYPYHAVILERAISSVGSPDAVVRHLGIIHEDGGIGAMRDFISLLLSRRDAEFIESVFETASLNCQDETVFGYTVFLIIYCSERRKQRRYLLKLMRMPEGLRGILWVYYRLASTKDSNGLDEVDDLLSELFRRNELNYVIKELDGGVRADDFLREASRLSRRCAVEGTAMNFSDWRACLTEQVAGAPGAP